jgi:hypothetical protein
MFPRFEIRSTLTGHLEAVHSYAVEAIRAADNHFLEWGETVCIVDACLPAFADDGTPDDRIIWRQASVSDAARAWIVERNRVARARRAHDFVTLAQVQGRGPG